MHKRVIQYENADGQDVSKECYFHLSKAELLELGLLDFESRWTKMLEAGDIKQLINEFKQIVLNAYGERNSDGEFVKNADIRAQFESSEAFGELIFELATDPNKATEFITATVPKSLSKQMAMLDAPLPESDGPIPANVQRAQLGLAPIPEDNDLPAWYREGREPTRQELMKMGPDEMKAAFAARAARQNQ